MTFNVRDFGARGDGTAVDSPAIQTAIDKCSAAGGGTVEVPAGTYTCGTIVLKSNVRLHLHMGAAILAAQDPQLFPPIAAAPNQPRRVAALIRADGASNIRVEGPGAIDGGATADLQGAQSQQVEFRPALVLFSDCRDVVFADLTMRNSNFWTLHLLRCQDVLVRGLTIRANRRRINTDGIDPDGCRNVIISDCNIDCGDDCIVVKSTQGDPCENITVANCVLSTTCAALKIGTEGLADIRNVTMSNCVIRDSNVALALYLKDAGNYENILFSNLIVEASNPFPIIADVTPRFFGESVTGSIRNITFENVMVSSAGRCYVEGLADRPVENLTLRNIAWNVTGPCRTEGVEKPTGSARVRLDPDRVNYAAKPYQFLLINARGLRLSNVAVIDKRPGACDRGLCYLNGVTDGRLDDVRGPQPPQGVQPIQMDGCQNVRVV